MLVEIFYGMSFVVLLEMSDGLLGVEADPCTDLKLTTISVLLHCARVREPQTNIQVQVDSPDSPYRFYFRLDFFLINEPTSTCSWHHAFDAPLCASPMQQDQLSSVQRLDQGDDGWRDGLSTRD